VRKLPQFTVTNSLLLALAYFATGRLGLMLPAFGSNITLIWLPTGLAVAAMWRCGMRCWPGITLGSFAVNTAIGGSIPMALAIAVGNTLAPVLTAWILKRIDFHQAFDRTRDILLLAGAATVGMLVSASVGVAALSVAGALPSHQVEAWLIWWAGDAMGVVIAAPILFALSLRDVRTLAIRRAEVALWLCTTVLAAYSVFVLNRGIDGGAWSVAVVPLPLMAWAALRYGPAGTSLALLVISVGAAYGTATGHGPFQRSQPSENAADLWLYMATCAVLGWVITALHSGRARATDTQRLFERALSDVSLGVLLTGADRRVTYVNEGFKRLTGYREAEVLGRSCALLHGPDTDPETLKRLRAAVSGDGSFEGEILNYRKDGTTFWNALIISPVFDERGKKTGFLGIQRDITKRKRAEASLRESEERYRRIVDTAEEGIWTIDAQQKTTFVNPKAARMLGYTIEEMMGRKLHDFMDEKARDISDENIRRREQGIVEQHEFMFRHKDGSAVWTLLSTNPIHDASGAYSGALAMITDITDRKEAAEELERSFATLHLFINSVPAYISFIDTQEYYRLVNRRYGEYFQRPITEIVGARLRDVHSPASYSMMQPHVRAALAGESVHYRANATGADGQSRWFDVNYIPRREEGGVISGFFALAFDITESKTAEDRLRESESRFRKLFEANPHPMWVHDFDSLRFLAVNDAAIAHYGYSREEFLKMTTKDIRPQEEIPTLIEEVKAVAAGKDHSGVWRHRKCDGTLIDAEVSAHAIEFGGHRAALVLALDVTERRRSQARTAGETAVLELLSAGASLPTVLDRLARIYEEVFPEILCSVLLLDAEGKHLRHGAAPSLPESFSRAVDGMEIGPCAGSCGTAAYTRRNTEVADIATDPLWKDFRDVALSHGLRACWSVPVISSQDRVLGTLALYYRKPATPSPEQISAIERGAHLASLAIERHQLLQSLRDSEARLQAAQERAQLGCWELNLTTHRGWWSREMFRLFECDPELGAPEFEKFMEMVHPDDRRKILDVHAQMMETGKSGMVEYRTNPTRARTRHLSAAFDLVPAGSGKPPTAVGTVLDITDIRQAQIEREQLDRKMQETQKLESLGVLAGGIAHDFNNLLTSILGNASIAAMDLPPGSPVNECIEQITEASMRAADLCKQMLAYSGRGRFIVQKLDLGQLVEQTAQMLQISISKKAVLRFRLEKGLPPVEVDATQIRQVIMNLVINASEAIGEQSGVISISTGLTRVDRNYLHGTLIDADLPAGDYVFLEVSDTGCGMSAETRAKIFDPFFTTKFTGRGLGLAAVLGIVRGHKGAMKVYSEVGRGTTFKLLFPAASGVTEASAKSPAASPAWRGEGSVLVVDDEETMRTTIARMLPKIGLEAVLVSDGREAVEVFRAHPGRFALVLLDLTMPHMDGEQTFTELRRIRPDVRVVLMSGFNAQEALVRFTGKGLASFLQKPFTIDELRSVLRSVMA
jgi:PAS domain S-box-containing protein